MTPIERRLLVEARELIRSRQQLFICCAIDDTHFNDEVEVLVSEAKRNLSSFILSALSGWGSLGIWLECKYPNFRKHPDKFNLQREARILWLTWLLGEECEEDVKDWMKRADL